MSVFFTPRNGQIVENPPWTTLFWKISIFTELINLHGTISSLVVSGFHNTRDTGPPLGLLSTYNTVCPQHIRLLIYCFSFSVIALSCDKKAQQMIVLCFVMFEHIEKNSVSMETGKLRETEEKRPRGF